MKISPSKTHFSAELPLAGKMYFTETTKETLLEYWQKVEDSTGLKINYEECVNGITAMPDRNSFEVQTSKGMYKCRAVVLSIGRRGTPRQLGVPGEDLAKVVYRLIDPKQYRGQHVLVVGGGDSALEAAHSIADEPGTTVTLSYRSAAFTRAKVKNREKIESLVAAGQMRVILNSNVKEIRDESVLIEQDGEAIPLANNAVIVSAGGILPTGFLKDIGITVETKFGTA